MVGEAGVNGEEDEEVKLLCLLGNNISVDIYSAYLDYGPLCGKDYTVEGSIM